MAQAKQKPQTVEDKFDRNGERSRRVSSEQLLVHSVSESKDEYGPKFAVEVRIIIELEDGRCLNMVCDIEMDEDDILA